MVRLTENAYSDWFPSFSYDGTKVAFVSNKSGYDKIYTMNINLANPQPDSSPVQISKSTTGYDDNDPFFSYDGKWIVFVTTEYGGGYEIARMLSIGGGLIRITTTTGDELAPFYVPTINIPSAPTALNADLASLSKINLTWSDNSNNETGFIVERKVGAGGSYTHLNIVGTNVNSYSDTGLSAATDYYYRIKAYNSAGNSAISNEASAQTPPADVEPPVTTASPVGGTYGSAQNVTLSVNEEATIYYTTNGTNPTVSSSVYSSPIPIAATTNLKFFAKDTAGNSEVVKTQTYTIVIPGDLNGDGEVTMTDAILALQVIAGMQPNGLRSNYTTSGADVNGDAKLGMEELLFILQRAAAIR
jgi:hypothetical protein